MARLVLPEDFKSQRDLFDAIKEKHDADGVDSPLIAYLAEKEIDLDADATAAGQADVQEKKRFLKTRQSQNYYQLRDLLFEPVAKSMRGQLQFLKAFVKPNVASLGDWGATVVGNAIKYPPQFNKMTELFDDIVTKNDSYVSPAVSPLAAYLTKQNINLTVDAISVSDATEDDTKAKAAAKDAEEATENRDLKWNPVNKHVALIGNFLMKLYKGNEKALGEWGFIVDSSPKAPKERTSTVKPADKITIKSITIGGTFTNISTVDLHVYKGTITTGTPEIVNPGEKLGMIKGYSTITVLNPDTLITAKFKVKVSQ